MLPKSEFSLPRVAAAAVAFGALFAGSMAVASGESGDQKQGVSVMPQSNSANSDKPLSPRQIVSEFVRLPPETQKLLLRILMSYPTDEEKQMSTAQLDAIYATLPDNVQTSLYARWNALSDEQRVGLKEMNPGMIKELLGQAVKAEIVEDVHEAIAPVEKAMERGRSLAKLGRDYLQRIAKLGLMGAAPATQD